MIAVMADHGPITRLRLQARDALLQTKRSAGVEAPRRRWRRYVALAAALVVVACLADFTLAVASEAAETGATPWEVIRELVKGGGW